MISLAAELDKLGETVEAEGLKKNSLSSLWQRIGMEKADPAGIGAEIFEDAFLALVREEQFETVSENLNFSPGGWVLKLWNGTARSAVLSALLWSMLSMAGYPQLPIVVIPAVLPLLFDLEKSRLSAGQECIYALLVMQPEVRDNKLNAKDLYESLPEKMLDELSFLDFVEFLEACYKSGLAEKHNDGNLTLLQKENRVFRLTIE